MLHLCVVRVLEGVFTDLQYQTLHRLLQILEGKLGQSLILVAEAASWHLLFVLVFHVKHFRLDFEVFEEGIQKVSRVLIGDKLIFVSIAPILRYLHWLKGHKIAAKIVDTKQIAFDLRLDTEAK